MNLKYIKLIERKDLINEASTWFSSKWKVPKEAYYECMDKYISGKSKYGWYLCLDENKIVGGLGVIDNDFHDRKDLAPNVCAVYVEEEYRNQGIAGKLLDFAVIDMKNSGVSPLFLVTNHTNFYERYGWEFYTMVNCDDGESRLYIHK